MSDIDVRIATALDGAHWRMLSITEKPEGAPYGHPSTWIWERTRATLWYALQGFVVRPHDPLAAAARATGVVR